MINDSMINPLFLCEYDEIVSNFLKTSQNHEGWRLTVKDEIGSNQLQLCCLKKHPLLQ